MFPNVQNRSKKFFGLPEQKLWSYLVEVIFRALGHFFIYFYIMNIRVAIKTAGPYSRLWIIACIVIRLNPLSFWKSDRPKKN